MSNSEPSDPIPIEKARLREAMTQRLSALSFEARRSAAAQVRSRLAAIPVFATARRVFTCLSFGDELDTWPLVESMLSEGREVYVPRADRSDGRLHVHRYPCDLVTLAFGLRQPRRGAPEVPAEAIDTTLDVILVLGLAFDRQGFRLGYGSGFFDRFLAGRTVPSIGLAFDAQVVDRLPVAKHDVAMSRIVTESALLPG